MQKRKIHLGINLGFAINKYFEPQIWTKIVREDLGLDRVQFVAFFTERVCGRTGREDAALYKRI